MQNWQLGLLVVLLCAAPAMAGKKESAEIGHAANDVVELQARVILDRPTIKSELGSDFDGNFTIVVVTVTPKGGKPLPVRLDDFLLRSERDGSRSGPFAPNQIAGQGGLVLHEMPAMQRSGPMGDQGGPIWGGVPGTGTQPRQLPGNSGSAGTGAGGSVTDARVTDASKEKPNPLLATLKAKVLPEKDTSAPISGMLYFPLEKQRPKDLELDYKGPAGPLKVRFR